MCSHSPHNHRRGVIDADDRLRLCQSHPQLDRFVSSYNPLALITLQLEQLLFEQLNDISPGALMCPKPAATQRRREQVGR